jgi:hypothetical protein
MAGYARAVLVAEQNPPKRLVRRVEPHQTLVVPTFLIKLVALWVCTSRQSHCKSQSRPREALSLLFEREHPR